MNIIANNIVHCLLGVYLQSSSWCTISGNKIADITATIMVKGVSLGSGSNNNTIDSNLIDTTVVISGTTGTANAGIFLAGGSGNKITHNQIQNCAGCGIVISAFDNTSYSYGNVVQYNYCQNLCTDATHATDCGAMYVYNASLMLNNNLLIDNNIFTINSSNSSTNQTVGVYLDNYSSGCTVTNNIILLGQKGFEIHGGMNNTFKNNIIDMATWASSTNCAGLFQGLAGFTGGSMTNNIVSGNMIYSTSTGAPTTVWQSVSSPVATISNNFYWNTNGQSMGNYTSGGLHDASPIVTNPDFVNVSSRIYDMGSNSTCIMDGFLPINQGLIGLAPKTAHFY
jgi:parallel beta-helix repeat protein